MLITEHDSTVLGY